MHPPTHTHAHPRTTPANQPAAHTLPACPNTHRGLAQCALAQGDACQALHHYGELVSKALMGRGSAEHWAYAEYGWLLFQVRAMCRCVYVGGCSCVARGA
jgi:hypothetical protein